MLLSQLEMSRSRASAGRARGWQLSQDFKFLEKDRSSPGLCRDMERLLLSLQ